MLTFNSRYTAIIPAAGIGRRMQSDIPKQYLTIAGKTLLEHCANVFLCHPLIDHVVVVVHPNDAEAARLLSKDVHVITGGAQRADSVLAGVQYAQETLRSEWVLVHDAARPGINIALIDNLIATVKGTEGGILALPAVDTVKGASRKTQCATDDSDAVPTTIDKTLNRETIWLAQTPQMFKTAALQQALEYALSKKLQITDEASAMELMGVEVCLVEGTAENFKVTKPADLALAGFYISQKNNLKGANACE